MGQIVDRRAVAQSRTFSRLVVRHPADALPLHASGKSDTGTPSRLPSVLSVPGASENAEGANMAHNCLQISDLKVRRHTLGWSINELGDRCGIEEKFLSDWEHGLGSPRLDAVQHWAAALGMTVSLVPAENGGRRGLVV